MSSNSLNIITCRPLWLVCTLRFKWRFRIIKLFEVNFQIQQKYYSYVNYYTDHYRRGSNKVLETKYENQLNKVTWGYGNIKLPWEQSIIYSLPLTRSLSNQCSFFNQKAYYIWGNMQSLKEIDNSSFWNFSWCHFNYIMEIQIILLQSFWLFMNLM